MKAIVSIFIGCCIVAVQAKAADEPLIPAPLNKVLSKVHPGMTSKEVIAVIKPSYPSVSMSGAHWSGATGFYEYKLDARFGVSITFGGEVGKEVVHHDMVISVYDYQKKHRADIKFFYWKEEPEKKPANQ
jgi:hypothetical protein